MISVSIDVQGLQEALSKLDKLKQIVTDFSPETKKIGDWLFIFLSAYVFETEGSAYGSSWRRLSEPYATQKLKKYGSQKILVATGQMKQGYDLHTSSDMVTIKNIATNAQGDYYAGYHQEGTSKMPRRVLIKMDNDRLSVILEILTKSLAERMMGLY